MAFSKPASMTNQFQWYINNSSNEFHQPTNKFLRGHAANYQDVLFVKRGESQTLSVLIILFGTASIKLNECYALCRQGVVIQNILVAFSEVYYLTVV